ncbi:MAG: YgiQ family radical SAM protein [Spirochaetales bacterium]|nr:YgiQ family radical SAM protein [Spirochaetales bacterium]
MRTLPNQFLPVSPNDMKTRGWDECDFICVTGDAYVDHPSFGIVLIARLLESQGFRVGMIAQPEWESAASYRVLGKPRLAFLVTAGNIDSMVNNYTAAKRHRHDDVYSPGRKGGLRPDRAAITYSIRIREAFGRVPIILGGLEASLRRLAHYDYWQDKVRKSVLIDSGADMIVYGMGEHQITEIAERLKNHEKIDTINDVSGTVVRKKIHDHNPDEVFLPSYEEITESVETFAKSFAIQNEHTDPFSGKRLIEPYHDCVVIQNPPAKPLCATELDTVYALPFTRTWHPSYEKDGGVPSIEEVQFSITSSRGCFGNCSFCSLTFHQGKIVSSRSHESIIQEAKAISELSNFKGNIHDVGGPTANFRLSACDKQQTHGACLHKECLTPSACKSLKVNHSEYISLLRKLRGLPNIKKVFIRSGIRFDYVMADTDDTFFRELCEHHVSGQLKVAPEHVSDSVLKLMNKTPHAVYVAFKKKFDAYNAKIGKKQYILPYFISSHPGATLKDAVALAEYFRDNRFYPEQVQDFYPTPGTVSTCMYHTGIDPRSGKKVFVAKGMHDKAMQRALMQYRNPANHDLVVEALMKAGRRDLVGFEKQCLVRPRTMKAGRRIYYEGRKTEKAGVDKETMKPGKKRIHKEAGKTGKERKNKGVRKNRQG